MIKEENFIIVFTYSSKIVLEDKTYNKIKIISFEITDNELLDKAGGVVQGMSGSSIIQNDKIIEPLLMSSLIM